MEKYIDRLLEEWITHGKIVIGVDYDDTIRDWKLKDYPTYSKVINLIRNCRETGAYITIFSACDEERYPEIETFCEAHNIKPDSINKNPIKLIYGNNGKIYANIFLDDRAGLLQAMEILETALYKYRAYLQGKQIQNMGDVA